MSADFWAGYISGAVGILIGNPLDLIKTRLQASSDAISSPLPSQTSSPRHSPNPPITTSSTPSATVFPASSAPLRVFPSNPFTTASILIRGVTAPILGYGALNALLFMTYNRTQTLLHYGSYPAPGSPHDSEPQYTLSNTFIAGALGGLATWVVSAPTELLKIRQQVSSAAHTPSIWSMTGKILKTEGVRGLYYGGAVTAVRDAVGYGFYFWSYEICTRGLKGVSWSGGNGKAKSSGEEAAKVLLCGGIAGVVTWASIFPLDVVKTRLQSQLSEVRRPLLSANTLGDAVGINPDQGRIGAWEMARRTYRNEGTSAFFRGLGVCSVRAFIVNAAQWAVYEFIMNKLEPPRGQAHTTVMSVS